MCDIILHSGTPVAFLCASVMRYQMHSDIRVMRQMYYQPACGGPRAVRALIYSHRLMIEEARRRLLPACITSSVTDQWPTMRKILMSDGWQSAGGMLFFETKR